MLHLAGPAGRRARLTLPRAAGFVHSQRTHTCRGGAMAYDQSNIFARILRGEIPCDKVYENEHALAFRDINPLAPHHVLVIPKGVYISMDDFSDKASGAEVAGLFRAVGEVARRLGLVSSGYRLLANHGRDANQEVPHFHVHIFGGAPLGRMLEKVSA